MENIKIYVAQFFDSKIVQSIIVILVSFFIYRTIKHFLLKGTKINDIMNKKSKTYFRMILSIIRYSLIIITFLVLLQINGIDVSSMLAGVGIASIIIGLAVQDALKDIIRGFSILSDNYFRVGDVVKFGDIEGKVIGFGLNATKIEDIRTLNVVSISNRNIEQIQVVSHSNDIVIPLPYEVKVEKAEEAINDIISEIKKLEKVEDSYYKSISKFDTSSLNYMINISCKPENKPQTIRDAHRIIVKGLAKYDIVIPYQQIDIHNK